MKTLRILHLDDNPLDVEVVRITLLDGGIDCDLDVVDTRAKFEAALNTEPFDLILADYALPGFDGLSALAMAQNRCPDVPFIFVSASLNEELAIAALTRGAADYVLKRQIEQLVSCVKRVWQDAQTKTTKTALDASVDCDRYTS